MNQSLIHVGQLTEVVDTEGGELLKRPVERPPEAVNTTNLTLPGEELEKFQSASYSAIPKESFRKADGGTKHPTTIEKGFAPLEDFSRDGKRGFYSPERKAEASAGAQYRLVPKDTQEMSPEMIKARVFTEYFSMIDDLVIVADMKLNIISNNFSAKIIENVISKFNKQKKRINMHNLKADQGAQNLEACFNFCEKDQIRCNEETVMNLIDIYTVLNYKLKKHAPEEARRFKEAKIDRILRAIEQLESGIKISKREEESAQASRFKNISKLKSSMRAINIKKSSLTVAAPYQECEFCIPEVLLLLKEYFLAVKAKSVKYHFLNTMILSFYFKENVQMKIRLVPFEEKYHILLILENILDKIKVGEATSKWNYSYMLIKTLSHELVTPLHQLLIFSNQLLALINKEKVDKAAQQEKTLSVKQIGMCLYFTVKNMLDYANIINHTFEPKVSKFLVKDVLLTIVEAFSSKAKKQGIQLKFECDGGVELVSDKERLTGLIFIFVDNSMRFTRKGGILITAQKIRSKVVFKVIDSGSGIENSDLTIIKNIINNPFLEDRTQNSAGLGIGFRIAQHLYKKLSGFTFEINSEVGYGTTIQFEIPQFAKEGYSKISSTISNKSRTNEVVFNAHIDMETEKQDEFRRERTTAFGEIAKAILQASKITPKHKQQESSLENRMKPLGCIEEEKTYQLKQNSSVSQNLDLLSIRQLDSMNSDSDDDKFDYQKPYVESPWLRNEMDELLSHGNVLESCRSPTQVEGEVSHRPDDPNCKWALIVDDDAFNNDIAKNMLIALGCSVYSADGGDAAIALCEELLAIVPTRKLDIVFMDYYMPDKYGCETTRILREPRFDPLLKDTPIIGLTANCDQETVTACLKAGMNLVENKPCDLEKFRELLQRFNILPAS